LVGALRAASWQRFFATPAGWAVLVALAVVLVDLLTVGMSGPWDPWETHYGEVARQMLARHDPLDTWWQPGNGGPDGKSETSFASKPVLSFWLIALSMKLFAIGTSADPAEMLRTPWVELALRLPSMLAGWLAAFTLGFTAWRLASPRAGVLAGTVVATMPQFAIVTRQALTDMIFVAPVVAAAAAWALAWLQPERALKTIGRGWRSLPFDRAYLLFLLVFALGVVVPLAVIHAHAFDPGTWQRVGRVARRAEGLRDIQQQMWIHWGLAAAVFVRSLLWRRRSQPLMGVLYVCAGLSLIGKGLIGPGLVGVIVLGHLIASGRWNLLLRCGLPTGIALFELAGVPWHHAMALYRGERWVNELIMDNNLRRFATGEQKQAVGSFGFYLETLGLAALPWSAVVPFAAAAGVGSFLRAREERGVELMRMAMVWLGVSLFAISYSTTKYYHYLVPCLPPAALCIGLWLDRELEQRRRDPIAWAVAAIGLCALAVVLRDAIYAPAWLAQLTTYLYTGMWTQGAPAVTPLVLTCLPFAAGLLAWPRPAWRPNAACAMVVGALLTRGWVIADYLPAASESWSQRSALRIYFEQRGPEDRLVSWWFYYRGETFFSKADIWVMKDPDKKALAELVEESRGRGVTLWFVTTVQHTNRLGSHLPPDLRQAVEPVYENFHYSLQRVPIP
jgi:4-amino-4-deoxy-L-arabinose transferase-like glycosyltransferase